MASSSEAVFTLTLLILSASALIPASFATSRKADPLTEVTYALTAAANASTAVEITADAIKKLLLLSSSKVDITGKITILLSNKFAFVNYNFSALTAAQTSTVINLHILKGIFTYHDLQDLPIGNTIDTKAKGNTLKKAYSSPQQVVFTVAQASNGLRSFLETYGAIFAKDLYNGTNVIVHGISSVLTPAEFTGGPYSTYFSF